DDGSAGYHGTVVDLLRNSDIPADTTVLSCGPKPMLKALVGYCEEKSLPVQVSLEERMGCGFGACVGCVCKLNQNGEIVQKRVCKDGPVFNGSEVIF
ncbi:MAG: dihydroorotate dehydrogenase electron transfer subunit, partial [Clostridia bacterium]|nr:dihydroorotate dehydrogenase electron transfer subunit [Clostridia bacterium]